jgi:predicted TIM-barrel fold metal-dependent hydrolase
MGIPGERNPLNTLECLLTKRLAPDRAYVFGGITYTNGYTPNADDHEKQLQLMLEAGCEGWKLLESKPSVYRKRQLPLDGEVFAKAFAFAEENNVPLTWHAGDPATFWSLDTAPAFAIENNWTCVGEGFPTLEKIYSEVENVMARHPKLRTAMAHLYFTSDDRAHAERMLDTYENFWLDLTPGSEMYYAFHEDIPGWTAFFEKYQDKLVFGTDMTDIEGDVVFGSQDAITELVLKTFMDDKPFEILDRKCIGMNLPQSVLDKILCTNFEKRVGAPKPINPAGLNAYVEYLMPKLTKEQQKRVEGLL